MNRANLTPEVNIMRRFILLGAVAAGLAASTVAHAQTSRSIWSGHWGQVGAHFTF